jgi:hypothetical protein
VGAWGIFPCGKVTGSLCRPLKIFEVRNAWSYTSSVEKHVHFTLSLKQPVLLGQDTVGSNVQSDVLAKK